MANTRDTGYLRNLVIYDGSGNITLPANLTVTGSIVGYATTSYVTTQINNLINGAPGLLDTLDELAAALGDDANFAATLTTSLSGKQASLSGTGFVKISGTTISYDNSVYLTTASATSTYLPLTGGTLTGSLSGTSASFSGNVTSTNAAATVNIIATGINSGTNGGSSLIAGTTGVTNIAIGNKSAILGGTFDSTSMIYWGNSGGLVFNNGVDRLTIASTGAATFSSSVTATSFNLGNGQFLRLTRNSGALQYDAFGIVSGTDNTRIISTGDFDIVNGSLTSQFKIASTGAATFSSSVTATSFVKSGGTSSQILAADGSVITAGTNITISGSTISSSGGSSTPTAISFTQTTPSGSFSMSYVTSPGIYFFFNSDISANGGSFAQQNLTIKSNTTIFSSSGITSILNTSNGAGFGSDITSLSLPNLVYAGATFSFGSNASLLNSLTLTSLKVTDAYFFIISTQLTTISLPALEFSRCLSFQSNSLLTTISLPNLKYVMDVVSPQSNTIQIAGTNNALTSITFPSIIRIKSSSSSLLIGWGTGNCTNLNTFSFGSGLLEFSGNDAGTTGSFSIVGAALNQASVDNILVRFAALDGTAGTVAFSNRSVQITGGTSSTPSASGLAAKSTLVARGCTVTNN